MKYSKRSLGQNFLIDPNIIKKIINLVDIKNKNIIEIGPGKGALTKEILKKKPKSLTLIEKDFDLFNQLEKKFFDNKTIKIYNEDILKFNLQKTNRNNLIVFGNLPYNISSQILVKFIKSIKQHPKINNIVFMFQKELGLKIIGKFASENYGRLSILSNLSLKLLNKFFVSPNCFFPKPKVTSMILHFKPKINNFYKIKKISNLEKITNILFSNKRKMVNKSLKKILSYNEIRKIKDLDLSSRPSELKPEVYYKIAEIYESK